MNVTYELTAMIAVGDSDTDLNCNRCGDKYIEEFGTVLCLKVLYIDRYKSSNSNSLLITYI